MKKSMRVKSFVDMNKMVSAIARHNRVAPLQSAHRCSTLANATSKIRKNFVFRFGGGPSQRLVFRKARSRKRMISRYNEILRTRPLLTKSFTAAVMASLGDAMSQIVLQPGYFDLERTLRFAGPAFLFGGVAGHYWYAGLCRWFPNSALTRTVVDQVAFAPAVLAVFFALQGLLENRSPTECKKKVKECLPPALAINYCLWPAAQYFNQRFIPLHHRVGFVSLVGCFWNAALSVINN